MFFLQIKLPTMFQSAVSGMGELNGTIEYVCSRNVTCWYEYEGSLY